MREMDVEIRILRYFQRPYSSSLNTYIGVAVGRYMARLVVKIAHHKDMFYNELDMYAQNINIINREDLRDQFITLN